MHRARVGAPDPCTIARRMLERPSVTMITEMIGSPISGRSTARSRASPSKVENAKVSSSAGTTGTFA